MRLIWLNKLRPLVPVSETASTCTCSTVEPVLCRCGFSVLFVKKTFSCPQVTPHINISPDKLRLNHYYSRNNKVCGGNANSYKSFPSQKWLTLKKKKEKVTQKGKSKDNVEVGIRKSPKTCLLFPPNDFYMPNKNLQSEQSLSLPLSL